MATVFAGGLVRWFMERRAATEEARDHRREQGVLFGSGLVGGEGVLGVLIAGAVFYRSVKSVPGETVRLPLEVGDQWLQSGAAALGLPSAAAQAVPQVAAVLAFAAFVAFCARCCRNR
jgi:hypothetical protein